MSIPFTGIKFLFLTLRVQIREFGWVIHRGFLANPFSLTLRIKTMARVLNHSILIGSPVFPIGLQFFLSSWKTEH